MLTRLIELCLRHRVVVVLITLIVAAYGVVALGELPFDAFPDTAPPQVTVNTVAEALTPLEIERQVTAPLEGALSGMPGLTQVRSLSRFGFSQVTVIFDQRSDPMTSRQLVAERVAGVELPGGVGRPTLGPLTGGLGEVFQYVLTSETRSATELRTLHDWEIRPRMLAVEGVAEVNAWGGYEKEYHVVVDPLRLQGRGLTVEDVERALQRNNRSVGGGVVVEAGEALLVQGDGLLRSRADIAAALVATVDAVPITVGDVADVREGHAIRRGATTAFGRGEHVMGLVFALPDTNTREVTRTIEARLEEVRRDLPDDVHVEIVYNRLELIDQVLTTVRANLLEGALLVIAILFMLMGNLRAGLIVALAIPLSMLFAFNLMLKFGIAGSLMSLGAIDFGLVVDSSVIMVENAERRLSEDQSGRPVLEIVRDAAVEVRRPTLFGELIITSVYIPILLLEGVEGELFRPMALTIVFALLGSMLLSMTLMPVLASFALGRRGSARREPWLTRTLRRSYARVLDAALAHRRLVIAIALAVVAQAAVLAAGLGARFVPALDEMALVANTMRLAGVSLDESVRYGTLVEQKLLAEFPDEIAHVWTRTGTGEVATDPMGLEVSDVFITLTPRAQWTRATTQAELAALVSATLEGMPGMRAAMSQPIELRINELTAGIRSEVGIKLFGDDLEILREKSAEIVTAVSALPEAHEVAAEQLTGQGVLQVEVDRPRAARYGLSSEDVLHAVELVGGRKVGEVFEGQRRFDIVVRLDDDYRTQSEKLGDLLIDVRAGDGAPGAPGESGESVEHDHAAGARVPLSAVATTRIVEGPAALNREWSKRRVLIQASLRDDGGAGGDVTGFVARAREAIEARVELPEGYYVEFGGQFEHYERAKRRLMVIIPLTLLLVLTLLYMTYGRASDTLRIMTGVPFAAVGGVFALWLRDMPFSISAAVGFVALMGIAVLGDIVLVSHVRALIARGLAPLEAVREGALTRMRPVLMTGLVAAVGFVPMALNTGVGADVQRPLATVVIGGVITSTLSTLIILPVLYVLFHRRRP